MELDDPVSYDCANDQRYGEEVGKDQSDVDVATHLGFSSRRRRVQREPEQETARDSDKDD